MPLSILWPSEWRGLVDDGVKRLAEPFTPGAAFCSGGTFVYRADMMPPPGWAGEVPCVDPDGSTFLVFQAEVVQGDCRDD